MPCGSRTAGGCSEATATLDEWRQMNLEQFFTPYVCHQTLPGRTVAVLAPHPDDEVFGCGGTLAQMAAAGADVSVIVLTDGVLRSECNDADMRLAEQRRHDKAAVRRQESCQAAALLGYPAPQFAGCQDGELLQHVSLADELHARLQRLQPDLLVAPSIWEMHRDHRAVAQVALALLQRADWPCQLAFYEVGVPLIPNWLVDITASQSRKAAAMQCFASQLAGQDYAGQISGLNRFRSYTLGQGVSAAEAFHLVTRSDSERFASVYRPDHHTLALLQAEKRLKNNHSEEFTKLQQALTEAQQNLAATRQTLSWRATAPLRLVKKQWRRWWN
jgi:LmbE family N-acetylglucosaminyl deacetylase